MLEFSAFQLHLPAAWPAAGWPRSGCGRRPGCCGVVRMPGHPCFVVKHPCRELAQASSRTPSPHLALDPSKVLATDEACETAVCEIRAPRILPSPIRHARCMISAPTDKLDAMTACVRRAFRAVIDALGVIVVEIIEIGEIVHAGVERAVGHHLNLHLPDLPIHGCLLRARTIVARAVVARKSLIIIPRAARWEVLFHDPAKGVHREALWLKAGVGALRKLARAAAVPLGVLSRAQAGGVRRAAALLCGVHDGEALVVEETPGILGLSAIASHARRVERVAGAVATLVIVLIVGGLVSVVHIAAADQRLRADKESPALAAVLVGLAHRPLADAVARLLEHPLCHPGATSSCMW
mmetsp:Transcript_25260/g.65981  ORF Transcript_25260/g.65981 Transcript_25260/m.65981 type:complete len:353 (-) Transcript_25260:502-1560(-)